MSDDDVKDEVEAISKLLGARPAGLRVVNNDKRTIANDARALFSAAVSDFGGDVVPSVRVMLTAWARRTAVAGFYDAMADTFGLSTEQGMLFANLAVKHQLAASKSFKDAAQAHVVLGKKGPSGLDVLRAKITGAGT